MGFYTTQYNNKISYYVYHHNALYLCPSKVTFISLPTFNCHWVNTRYIPSPFTVPLMVWIHVSLLLNRHNSPSQAFQHSPESNSVTLRTAHSFKISEQMQCTKDVKTHQTTTHIKKAQHHLKPYVHNYRTQRHVYFFTFYWIKCNGGIS